VIGFRRPGAYAERVTVPARNVVPAGGLTPTQAVLPSRRLTAYMHGSVRAAHGTVAIIGAARSACACCTC